MPRAHTILCDTLRTCRSLKSCVAFLALLTGHFVVTVLWAQKHRLVKAIPGQYYEVRWANNQTATHTDAVDAGFLGDHWVAIVDSIPLHKSYMVHAHHVCTKGGQNGLVVPHIGHVLIQMGTDHRYLPNSTYPVAFRTFTDQEVLTLFSDGAVSPRLVTGPSIFLNCWHRHPADTNPAHWLMKVHKLFEIGETSEDRRGPLPTFESIVLHQCPSLKRMAAENAWPWGLHVFKAATSRWTEKDLWKSFEDVTLIELMEKDREWKCFEDLFMEVSYGMWFPPERHQQTWRVALNKALDKDNMEEGTTLATRCSNRQLRIVIFQRSSGSARAFINLDEVMNLLSSYTSIPVPIVTVNASSTVNEQARLFKSFDLLVTPHGSHLANIIFAVPQRTAVVEVLPVVRDLSFQHNAMDAKMASYIVSTGHIPSTTDGNDGSMCTDGEEYMNGDCRPDPRLGDKWTCTNTTIRNQLTSCDMIVNLSILREHIEKSVFDLCEKEESG